MAKMIQIPEELFYDLVRYHWMEDRSPELEERIKSGLELKVRAMAKRESYSRNFFSHYSKTAP